MCCLGLNSLCWILEDLSSGLVQPLNSRDRVEGIERVSEAKKRKEDTIKKRKKRKDRREAEIQQVSLIKEEKKK